MKTFTAKQASDILMNDPGVVTGQSFGVSFVKKDGTVREGTFRIHFDPKSSGTGRKGWKAEGFGTVGHYELLTVLDMGMVERGMKWVREEFRLEHGRKPTAKEVAAARDALRSKCIRMVRLNAVGRIAASGKVWEP
jgi:hypothetical protein